MSTKNRKHVLDVGQCQADHAAIRKTIREEFDAEVEYAADITGALNQLCETEYDLVLVNRIIDATANEGLELISRMQASTFLNSVPVMLISNFEAAQQEAMAKGAVQGFGKAELDEAHVHELLRAYLTPQT